jgi:hypothetical protein
MLLMMMMLAVMTTMDQWIEANKVQQLEGSLEGH